MRLRPQDLHTVYLRRRGGGYDDEGNPLKGWGDAIEINANVQPANGQLNASLYGERLAYMLQLKYQGDMITANHDEGAGICVDVLGTDKPDYKIISIQQFATHKNILIERLERGTDGNGA